MCPQVVFESDFCPNSYAFVAVNSLDSRLTVAVNSLVTNKPTFGGKVNHNGKFFTAVSKLSIVELRQR